MAPKAAIGIKGLIVKVGASRSYSITSLSPYAVLIIATSPCKSTLWYFGESPDLLCAQPPLTHVYAAQFDVNLIEKLLLQLLLLPSDMSNRLKKL